MLKIKDKTGKQVALLKDDGDAPEMTALSEPLPPKKKEVEEETVEEEESKEDADVC